MRRLGGPLSGGLISGQLSIKVCAVLAVLMFAYSAVATEYAVGATSRTFFGQGSREDVPVEVFYPVTPTSDVERETHSFVFDARVARDAPPLTNKRRPLVMLSHGHEGTQYDLFWLAEPLVKAGFIVAAVEHPRNHLFAVDWVESLHVWHRPQDVSSALSGMLSDNTFGPLIDKENISAAGHSVGGYTVLALAGARYSIENARRICRNETPDDPTCTAVAKIVAATGTDLAEINYEGSADSYRDTRIKNVFAFAPAVGEALYDAPLESSTRVHIFSGNQDQIAPHYSHAERWARRLGLSIKLIEYGDHYTFISPCNWLGSAINAGACFDPPWLHREQVQAKIAVYVIDTLSYRPR